MLIRTASARQFPWVLTAYNFVKKYPKHMFLWRRKKDIIFLLKKNAPYLE